jgi:hypothetical protein
LPEKPLWVHRLPEVLKALERLPVPWVDRATVEDLLHVRRRQAQKILAPLATQRCGCSTVVERSVLVRHLERLASGETAYYEQKRRERVWAELEQERRRWLETPPAFVHPKPEMLQAVYKEDFEGLPAGVDLGPGRIEITFEHPTEALEKLLALAMAIGQNQSAFEDRVGRQQREALPFPV